jgi:hypothetical protein
VQQVNPFDEQLFLPTEDVKFMYYHFNLQLANEKVKQVSKERNVAKVKTASQERELIKQTYAEACNPQSFGYADFSKMKSEELLQGLLDALDSMIEKKFELFESSDDMNLLEDAEKLQNTVGQLKSRFCLSSASERIVSQKLPMPLPLPPNRQFHAFLAHDWGTEESNYLNHRRVSSINAALRKRGLVTWFDDERMSVGNGDIRSQMRRGIERSEYVLIFLTERYERKVNSEDMRDNCYFEFQYATNQRSNHRILVVMQPEMRDFSSHPGVVSAELGGQLFCDFSSIGYDDDDDAAAFEEKCDELAKTVISLFS